LEKTTRLVPALALVLAACAEHASESELGAERQAAVTDHWVGTWAASPQGDGTTFADKTLRQIVRTSIGGSSVRIRLSNVFGNQPLSVDNVHIAERANGSSIAPASDHALKFGGQTSLSIPAGQVAVSDAVAFDVKPLSDLAISFHLASTAGSATAHGTGLQDNYVASGNVAGDQNLTGTQTKGSYYFLTNVDVQSTEAWGAVVALGASITDGVASGGNNNRRWPNDLAKRLSDAKLPVGVLNQGISGNRLLADGNGDSALKRFDRDVLSQTGVRWVVFSDDPINDLGNGNPPSGAQLIDGLKQLVAKAHAAKIEFWCSTLTPFQGAGGWKPEAEIARAQIIAFIKSADSGCDQIVDQDTATHDPAKPTWYLPDYDAGDHLHPNEKGLQAIADAVDLKGFTAPDDTGGGGASAGTGGAGGSAGGGGAGAPTSGVAGSAAGTAAGGNPGVAGQPNGGGTAAANAGSGGATPQAGASSLAGSAGAPATPATDSSCDCRLGAATSRPPWSASALLALVGALLLRRPWRRR
jgi:lysophospholipase L1-like esterase